jgi:glycosyltransferase involved in cell wall biosynthesis
MSTVRDQKQFAWGAGARQRLRLTPLFLCLSIADRVGGALRTRTARLALPPWRAGLSIIIPERDSPQLLLKALASLDDALDAVDEPYQVVVVANGAARNVYDEVVAKYPFLEWVHHRRPLGFSAAIHRGLRRVQYDWTFLMNNDMTLDRSALREVCALRSAEVFAIACQIHQQSASGRREETGFTDWYVNAAGVQVFHADPGAEDNVRSHLCASGGAGLFRTAPLREYARDSRCYDPFYWEERAVLPGITRLAPAPGDFVALLRGTRNRTHRRAEPNPVRRKKRDHRTRRRLADGKGLRTFL